MIITLTIVGGSGETISSGNPTMHSNTPRLNLLLCTFNSADRRLSPISFR